MWFHLKSTHTSCLLLDIMMIFSNNAANLTFQTHLKEDVSCAGESQRLCFTPMVHELMFRKKQSCAFAHHTVDISYSRVPFSGSMLMFGGVTHIFLRHGWPIWKGSHTIVTKRGYNQSPMVITHWTKILGWSFASTRNFQHRFCWCTPPKTNMEPENDGFS